MNMIKLSLVTEGTRDPKEVYLRIQNIETISEKWLRDKFDKEKDERKVIYGSRISMNNGEVYIVAETTDEIFAKLEAASYTVKII